ncbi:MAG: hypothetical protein Q9171_002012 [Xanthocarpia ochracea]
MPASVVASVSDDTQTTSTNNILDPLREACAHGRTEEARELLTEWKNTANPVPRRPPKRPTVHLHPALLAAIQENHLATASMLLDEGFTISYEEVRAALTNRSTAMLQIFLSHGWNINRTLGPSMAPALTRVLDDEELVRWFVTHGADPNKAIPSWPSPLESAAWKASLDVIKILVDHGGRVYPSNALPAAAKTSLPNRTEILAYFLDHGAPINMIEYEFDDATRKKFGIKAFGTALHHASKRGNEQMVRFLLERGAATDLKDSVRKTPMQYAQEKDHQGIVSLLEQAAIVQE